MTRSQAVLKEDLFTTELQAAMKNVVHVSLPQDLEALCSTLVDESSRNE